MKNWVFPDFSEYLGVLSLTRYHPSSIFIILVPEKTCNFLACILSVLGFIKVVIYVTWPTHPLIHTYNTFISENVTYKSAVLQASMPVDKYIVNTNLKKTLQNHLFHIMAIPLLERS